MENQKFVRQYVGQSYQPIPVFGPGDISEEDRQRLKEEFEKADNGMQGELISVPQPTLTRFGLPGNYAYVDRYEDREIVVTFQTYEEMMTYIKWTQQHD